MQFLAWFHYNKGKEADTTVEIAVTIIRLKGTDGSWNGPTITRAKHQNQVEQGTTPLEIDLPGKQMTLDLA